MKTVYVDPDATGSADGTSWTDAYTSLSAAEAAEEGSLSDDITFTCRASSGTADTAQARFNAGSWTLNGYTIRVEANRSEATGFYTGNAGYPPTATNVYRLEPNNFNVLWFDDMPGVIDGLCIKSTRNNNNVKCVSLNSNGATGLLHVNACRVVCDGKGNCIAADGGNNTIAQKVTNNVVQGGDSNNGIELRTNMASGDAILCYNNSCNDNNNGIVWGEDTNVTSSTVVKIVNNYVTGETTTAYSGPATPTATDTQDYNAGNSSTAPTNHTNWVQMSNTDGTDVTDLTDTAPWDDTDYSVVADGALDGAGLGSSSDSNVPTDDLWGTTRSTTAPCIGAYELEGGVTTTVTPGKGSLTLTGKTPTTSLVIRSTVAPTTGAAALVGKSPTLSLIQRFTAAPLVGVTALAGVAPELKRVKSKSPGVGALSIEGKAPLSTFQSVTAVPSGALTLGGGTPTLKRTIRTTPDTGAVVLVGIASELKRVKVKEAPKGSLTLNGLVGTLSLIKRFTVIPPSGVITLGGKSASLSSTTSVTITVGTLATSGLTPSIALNAVYTAQPINGTLGIVGKSSTTNLVRRFTTQPSIEELNLAGLAITVGRTYRQAPNKDSIVLIGKALSLILVQRFITTPAPAALKFNDAGIGQPPTPITQLVKTPKPPASVLTLVGKSADLVWTTVASPGTGLINAFGEEGIGQPAFVVKAQHWYVTSPEGDELVITQPTLGLVVGLNCKRAFPATGLISTRGDRLTNPGWGDSTEQSEIEPPIVALAIKEPAPARLALAGKASRKPDIKWGAAFDFLDYYYRNTALNNTASATKFTWSAYVKWNAFPAQNQYLWYGRKTTSQTVDFFAAVDRNDSFKFKFLYYDTNGTLRLALISNAGIQLGRWYRFLISGDTVAETYHMYDGDTSILDNARTFSTASLSINWPGMNQWIVGARPFAAAGTFFVGCLGEFYLNDVYQDFSVQANRRFFVDSEGNPTWKGYQGTRPGGPARPLIYGSGRAVSPGTFLVNNFGDGGILLHVGGAIQPSNCRLPHNTPIKLGAISTVGKAPTVEIRAEVAPTVGSITLVGKAPIVTKTGAVIEEPGVGSLTLVGKTPTIRRTYVESPASGVALLNGLTPTATLNKVYTLQPDKGTLAVVGKTPVVDLVQRFVVAPTAGVISLQGLPPIVRRVYAQAPDRASLSVAGKAPTLNLVQRFVTTPTVGTLVIAGLTAVAVRHTVAVPAKASITVGGLTPTLVAHVREQPTSGSLTLNGKEPSVILEAPSIITKLVPRAAIEIVGKAPVLTLIKRFTVAPPADSVDTQGDIILPKPTVTLVRRFIVQPGSDLIALSGKVSIIVGRLVVGSVVVVGKTPITTLVERFTTQPGTGGLVALGKTPSIQAANVFTSAPTVGAVTLIGKLSSVTLVRRFTVEPGVGAISLGGKTTTLTLIERFTAQPNAAQIFIAGKAPAIQTANVITKAPASGVVLLDGLTASTSLVRRITVAADAGSISSNGKTPTITLAKRFSAQAVTGSILVVGLPPTLRRSFVIAPVKEALTTVGKAPIVELAGRLTSIPQTGTATAVGIAPTITVVRRLTVQALVGSLTSVGKAPQAQIGVRYTASPTVGQCVVSGIAPTIKRAASPKPSTASITLSGTVSTLTLVQRFTKQTPVGQLVALGAAATPDLIERFVKPAVKGGITLTTTAPPTAFVSIGFALQPLTGTIAFNGLALTLKRRTVCSPSISTLRLVGLNGSAINAGTFQVGVTRVWVLKRRETIWKPLKPLAA